MFQPQAPHLPPADKGWGCRGPVLLPLLGGRAGGPGGDSAGLSAAGAGAHRTGPVGAPARGCALAPGGEAAEGGTGGIRSLHGNSCTDSGGWAGARGGGRRGGSRQGGGEGRGEGARRRRERAHSRAHSSLPHTLLPSSVPPSAGPSVPAQSPAASHPAPAPRASRTSGAFTLSPAEALPGPSADLVPCSGDWPGIAWSEWASPLPLPGQRDNRDFVPTAGEGQFHV